MNCREIEELLSAFIDGEAAPGERRLVARHVEGCRACAHKLRLTAGLKASVKKLASPPTPAALKARLRQAAAGRRGKAPWTAWARSPFFRVGVAGAFAAASVVVILRLRTVDENVPVDALLAAHNQYALTMPLSPVETLVAGLAERTAEGDAHGL